MKTYSQDLREKLLATVDRGMPRKEAVGVFGVSPATLKRWLKRREQTGSVAPKRRPGMRPRVGSTAEERHALWRRLEENPEATLQEHREAWERECGVRISVATMSRAIRRLGWTYKKDAGSLRTGRGGPSPLARAGSTPRPRPARVRGRVRLEHRPDAVAR